MSNSIVPVLLLSLVILGCSNDDGTVVDVAGIRASLITGLDESSTGYWECAFDISTTVEVETGTNTITFWENDRGITGGGFLYSWSMTSEGSLEGIYDNGERTFVFEDITFGDTGFTAFDTSTRNIGTSEERTLLFNADCKRFAS